MNRVIKKLFISSCLCLILVGFIHQKSIANTNTPYEFKLGFPANQETVHGAFSIINVSTAFNIGKTSFFRRII